MRICTCHPFCHLRPSHCPNSKNEQRRSLTPIWHNLCSRTKTKHSKHVLNIQSFPQAATLSHIAVIRNWDAIPFPPLEWHHSYPQGIYRSCSLDEFFEICEVSSSQERALSKRFPKNMFRKPSLLPLTRLQWPALQTYNNNHHGRTSLSNFFICSCVPFLPSRHTGILSPHSYFWCSHGTMRHYGSVLQTLWQLFFLKNIKLALFVLIQFKMNV